MLTTDFRAWRRLATCCIADWESVKLTRFGGTAGAADWQSAIQPTASRRYVAAAVMHLLRSN